VTTRHRLHVIHVPGVDPIRDAAVATLQQEADVCLHPDTERRGVMWNWVTAMDCIAGRVARPSLDADWADWHFVVQDDMRPYPRWEQELSRATKYSPALVLGLCWIGERWSEGVAANRPYMTGKYILRGGAIAYHRSVFPALSHFARGISTLTTFKHDDVAASLWCQRVAGFDPALTSRCLFESLMTRSLVSHGRYPTGVHSIENTPGPDWATMPRSIEVNIDRYRSDTNVVLAEMKKKGWRP